MVKKTLIGIVLVSSAWGEAQDARRTSWTRHIELLETSLFQQPAWRSVGPSFLGGRIESIAVPKGARSTFYVGAGSGNVWKTVNNGLSFEPIFERESTFAVGALAVAPSDPDVVWVGTGEVLMARSSFAGTGVFKSTNGGESFRHVGLEDTYHIGRVLVHPEDRDTVYVAAIGHNYTFNEERGLFKTTDGGESWDKILYVSERAGVVEVVMAPEDPETLYAVSWERDRKAWNNVVSGEGSGLHKSTDGGRTWKRLTGGLPTGDALGRIGIAIAPSRPSVMYAIVDNRRPAPAEEIVYEELTAAELEPLTRMTRAELLALDTDALEKALREHGFTSKHTGASIAAALANGTLEPDALVRAMRLSEDRHRSRRRVVGGELYRSEDAGESWRKMHEERLPTAIGYDFCLVRVSPDDENQIYVLGNYLLRSDDGGRTYERNEGTLLHLLPHESTVLHLDQHELWIDPEDGDRLILGNDGGVHHSYDRGETWLHVNNLPIGEFYAVDVDMASPYKIYGGTQDDAAVYGPPWRHVYLDRWGGGDSYFTFPDPTDPDTIYYEHQFGRLRRKNFRDGSIVDIMPEAPLGEEPLRYNWMSPFFVSHHNPLTIYFGANRLFKSTNRGDSWTVVSPDLSTHPGPDRQGNVPFGALTALSESTLKQGLLYAGTDDGNVWVTRDDGRAWTLVSQDLPSKWVSRVVASRHALGTVYVTLTGYREDDFTSYVYASSDHGRTWRSIVANLPDEPVNVLREDTENPGVLYLGTDLGAYVSIDGAESWQALMSGLPTTPVHDLRVHPRDRELVAGTHGRSIFVLDVDPIRALTAEVLAKELHLFDVSPARLARRMPGRGVWEQEPNEDAVIYFYTRSSLPVDIVVRTASGDDVETVQTTSERGLNRHVFRLTPETHPGTYRIELRSDGAMVESSFVIQAEP